MHPAERREGVRLELVGSGRESSPRIVQRQIQVFARFGQAGRQFVVPDGLGRLGRVLLEELAQELGRLARVAFRAQRLGQQRARRGGDDVLGIRGQHLPASRDGLAPPAHRGAEQGNDT